MRIWLILILLGCCTLAVSARPQQEQLFNSDPEQVSDEDLNQVSNRDSLLIWQEKVFLHISKGEIRPRGKFFFKAYLTTGLQGFRLSLSNVLKIELVDDSGEIFHRQYHPISDGMASGSFEIPRRLKEGNYYLQAYTRWMQNYGSSTYALMPIYIGDSDSTSEYIQDQKEFYGVIPEGGQLVNGLNNRLVLRLGKDFITNNSLPVQIIDQPGEVVGELTSYDGIYTTTFRPVNGKQYRMRISDDEIFGIPDAIEEGYLIHVNNMSREKTRVRVTTTPNFYNSKIKIVGEIGQMRYLEREFNVGANGIVDFEFSKGSFPGGIMTLRLLDMEDRQLAYRPIWIDKKKVKIKVSPLEINSEDGNEIAFQISVTDSVGSPVLTQLAVSVKSVNSQMEKSSEIRTINYYGPLSESGVVSDDRKERFLTDLYLLGMSEEIHQDRQDLDLLSIRYPVQKGLELYGHAYSMENELLRDTDIQLMAFSDDEIWAAEIKTDSNGALRLENLQLTGESQLVFRIKGTEKESTLVKVIPASIKTDNNSKSLEKSIKGRAKNRVFDPSDYHLRDTAGLIALDEVVLEELKPEKKKSPSLYNVNPTRVSYQIHERPKTIPQLLLEMPGVIVTGLGSINPSVSVLRAPPPVLWVIDGFPISTEGVTPTPGVTGIPQASTSSGFPGSSSSGGDTGSGGTVGGLRSSPLAEVMSIVSAFDVEKIELLLGPDAAIFGSRVAGAVFLIYTRTASNLDRSLRKEAQLKFQGFQPEINFEEYFEELSRKEKKSSGTIYWNPEIKTDAEGKAIIRFSVEDKSKPLTIKVTTVMEDGRIGLFEDVLFEE